MGRKCVVKNCKMDDSDTWHRIPTDKDERNIWLDLLDLPDTVKGRVCSKHFEPSDFRYKGDGHVWLKRNAYPLQVEESSGEKSLVMNEVKFRDATLCDPSIMSARRYCFVVSCLNNSKKNPEKYFFRVPYTKNLRDKWCKAVGRLPDSIKACSPTFCCSDHFVVEADLDPVGSSDGNLVLKKGVIPSLKLRNNQASKGGKKEVPDILGKGSTATAATNENLYVREVVYIEEKYDGSFLEENNELEDALNIEPINEMNDPTKKSAVKISGDQNSLKSVPPAVERTSKTLQNKIVPHGSIKDPTQNAASTSTTVAGKSVVLRQGKQLNVVGTQSQGKIVNSSVPMPTGQEMFVKYKLIKPNPTPVTVRPKQVVLPVRLNNPIIVQPNAVNKLKYMNLAVLQKSRDQQNIKKSTTQSDDDDCIVVEEQNTLTNNASSNRLLSTLPPSISVKYSTTGVLTTQAIKQVPGLAPLTGAIVPPEPKLRVREFSKVDEQPDANQDSAFKIIKLMVSENQMILAQNKGNLVKIARTKYNEFRILDNVYYYRTSDEFDKNYFFMNITRNSRDDREIILRNYGIYWGNPRLSCVGIVETKGPLDETTKDFIFQQVKKSLFNENSRQLINLQADEPPRKRSRGNSPAGVDSPGLKLDEDYDEVIQSRAIIQQPKTVTRKAGSKMVIQQPGSSKTVIQQPDGRKILIQPPGSKMVVKQPDGRKILIGPPGSSKMVIQQPGSSKTVIQPAGSKVVIQQPSSNTVIQQPSSSKMITQQPGSKVLSVSTSRLKSPVKSKKELAARSGIRKLLSPVKAYGKSLASPSPINADAETKPEAKMLYTDASTNNELFRLSKYLTPTVRMIINKLKHFELDGGKVYAVTIGPYCPRKMQPFNLLFTEMNPESNVETVLKSLYVSQLVDSVFKAVNPSTKNRISIPSSHDITSVVTPEVMEGLLISENKEAYNNLISENKEAYKNLISENKEAYNNIVLLDSTKTSPPVQKANDFKHKCKDCSETFERKYQLKRHQFVKHYADNETAVAPQPQPATTATTSLESKDSVLDALISNTIKKAFMDIKIEPCSSDTELQSGTETKQSEGHARNEESLLVPLFEVSINERQDLGAGDDFSLVKVKQEPEEHFDEITALPYPVDDQPTGRAYRNANKRNNIEDTDSASERYVDENMALAKMNKRRNPKPQGKGSRKVKRGRIARLKNGSKSPKKRGPKKRKKTAANKKQFSAVPVVPVKLSKANQLLKKWPSLSVNLVNIGSLKE